MTLTFVLCRGVPQTIYRSTSKITSVANEIFPEAEEASELYVHINDGQLTILPEFGRDPLLGNEHKMNQRLGRFLRNYEFPKLFDDLTNSNPAPFENAILHFIDITYQLLGVLMVGWTESRNFTRSENREL